MKQENNISNDIDVESLIYNENYIASYTFDTSTYKITNVIGTNNTQKNNNISENGILSDLEFANIKKLIRWIISKYNNKIKSRLKISFVLSRKNEGFKTQSHKVKIYFDKQTYPEVCRLIIHKLTGIHENLRTNIIISSEVAGKYYENNIDYVIDSFSFETILKKYEFSVLNFLVQGYTADEIGEILYLSKHTVNDYKKQLNEIFKSNNMYQLIKNAKKKNII